MRQDMISALSELLLNAEHGEVFYEESELLDFKRDIRALYELSQQLTVIQTD